VPTLARLRRVIAAVPRGRVVTYGQVAEAAGFPRAARLTVRALQRADELPWHRVVASGGRIALPGEEGREQRLRLKLEGVTFRGGRVRMDLHAWNPARSRKRRSGKGTIDPLRKSTRTRASRPGETDVGGELIGFGPRPKPLGHRRFPGLPGELEDG